MKLSLGLLLILTTSLYASGANTPAVSSLPVTLATIPEAAPAKPPEAGPVAPDLAKAKRFLPSIVFYTEKGTREYKTKRWVSQPRLEIIGQDKSLTAMATALHASIFEATGPLPAGQGKITVYIGPAKELTPIRNKLMPQAKDGAWSYWTNWNPQREFTQATIFLITDRMNEKEAGHALARCLMSSVGFPDDSKEYKESILNPDNMNAELAPIDKRAISFIYKNTPPGIGREALLAQLSLHWK